MKIINEMHEMIKSNENNGFINMINPEIIHKKGHIKNWEVSNNSERNLFME
jgi:hypothetical protein